MTDINLQTENLSDDQWTRAGYPPKAEWPEGPWKTEPDKLSWHDAEYDLACLMVRGRSGAWCGYVGVPPGHPWHGKGYDDVNVDVHGGLSYARPCQEDGLVCHVPLPGKPADVHWLGFDCGHAFDIMPGMQALLTKLHRDKGEPPPALPITDPYGFDAYRDVDYVRGEVRSLARQVHAAQRADA